MRLVACFLPQRPEFSSRFVYLGFVVSKVVPGQVFSRYIGFPCQCSFHQTLHFSRVTSGLGVRGQLCQTTKELILIALQEWKKNNSRNYSPIMGHEGSLQWSQKLASNPCLEQNESSSYPPTIFISDTPTSIFQGTFISLGFRPKCCMHWPSPLEC
jgi:hypothetical protein